MEQQVDIPEDKSKLLSNGPIVSALFSIMIPMAIMMATSIGFSYLDSWDGSRLGEDAFNAMDISFPLINLCTEVMYASYLAPH